MKPGLFVPTQPCALLGLELCTSVGWNRETTVAEIAADTLEFHETDVDQAGDELVVAGRLRAIPAQADHTERTLSLAAAALTEHLRAVGPFVTEALRLTSVPVILALNEPADGRGEEAEAVIGALRALAAECAPSLELEFLDEPDEEASPMGRGRAGYLAALGRGLRLIADGRCSAVIVGAADTGCDPDSLDRLVENERALGPRQVDGLIPGEAASFGLLVPARLAASWREGGVRILAVSLAREPHPFTRKDEPNLAIGLSRCFRMLREHPSLAGRAHGGVLSCQPMESFWAEELAQASLRNAALMPEPFRLLALGSALGDVGAAAGAVQLAVAQQSPRQSEAPADARGSRKFLVYACSDDGLCAACLATPIEPSASRAATTAAPSLLDRTVETLEHTSFDRDALHGFVSYASELHASEIGFLLSQREVYFDSLEIPWSRTIELEQRLQRHMDALAAWGAGAREHITVDLVAGADADLALGAAFLLASGAGQAGGWPALIDAVRASSLEVLGLWEHALRLVRASGVGAQLGPLLDDERPELVGLAARVLAYRAEGGADLLLRRLQAAEALVSETRAALCTALGAIGGADAAPLLLQIAARYPEEPEALRAACLMGDPAALALARNVLRRRSPAPGTLLVTLALAAASEADASLILSAEAQSVQDEIQRCVALGVWGSPQHVTPLVERLAHPEPAISGAAEGALERMTGVAFTYDGAPAISAGTPSDEADETDEIEVDEGAKPPRDGAQAAQLWRSYWEKSAEALSRHGRLRLGRPFSLGVCCEEAAAPLTRRHHRQLAMDELQARLGPQGPLRADGWVDEQRRVLATYRRAAEANQERARPARQTSNRARRPSFR